MAKDENQKEKHATHQFFRSLLDCATLPKVIRPPDHRLLSDLAAYDPEVSNLTLALREVILEEAPDAIESIVKGYALAIGF